jgi:hypothetical protein
MTKPRVLISDKMDPNAARIFAERGCDVDVKPGMTKDELTVLRYRVGQMLAHDTHSAWPAYSKGGILAILPKKIIRRAARSK